MNYLTQYNDSISTVQLSPFGEIQWNRIVTYSPIYFHWTNMLMMSQKRTNKTPSGKLNSIDQIDLNALKLEDEILLNELYLMRKAAGIPSKEKNINHELKASDNVQDQQLASSTGDYQRSSSFFEEPKDTVKHHCSYVEPSLAQQQYNIKRALLTNQTTPPQVNVNSQVKKLTQLNFGPKPQPSLSVQLRQSSITREHALSATHDRHTVSPLSMSSSKSSKRTTSSAHSSLHHRHHHPQQQQQHRTLESPLSAEINSTNNTPEQSTRELSSVSVKKARTRSINSSRSTIHMVKTKNDRTRQKQNIELKTQLVEPWKHPLYGTKILDDKIPNSLELMNNMCGPATAFEQNLRYNFHRQLNQFRNGSMKS